MKFVELLSWHKQYEEDYDNTNICWFLPYSYGYELDISYLVFT